MFDENESPVTLNDQEVITEKRTRKIGALSIFVTCIVIILCSLFIQFEVRYDGYKVEGVSMQPTLNAEGKDKTDFVYVNKYCKIKKNDIVVLKYNKDGYENIVKRVIAVGSDKVNIVGIGQATASTDINYPDSYESYGVMVNGAVIDEPYLNSKDKMLMKDEYIRFFKYKKQLIDKAGRILTNKEIELLPLPVSPNAIFVLGDNRKDSTDSSTFGEVDLKEKVGRVDFIVPFNTSPWEHFFKKLSFLFIFK